MKITRKMLCDTDPDIADDISQLESDFPIQVQAFAQDDSRVLAGDVLTWTILAFILGGVSSGFLGQAGADLWSQLKKFSRKVFERRTEQTSFQPFDSHQMDTILVLEIKGIQIVISNHTQSNTFVHEKNVSKDLILLFFDELESQLPHIIDKHLPENEDAPPPACLHVEYLNIGNERGRWIANTYQQRLTVDDIARLQGLSLE